jgi:hypothetical protein
MHYHVFISHNAEDQSIARTLKSALKVLSQFQLKIHLSEEMPNGADWRKWIESNLLRSDKLIFLYTSTESEKDWRWCVYEIGIFYGNKISKTKVCETKNNQGNNKHDVLCIKHPDIPKPPKPIENIQVCDANEPGIKKLFEQLLYEKCEFLEEPLVTDRDQDLFGEQVNKVVSSFNPPVKIDFFEKRLIITLSEIEDKEIKEKELENSDLSGNSETMVFLKLPQQGAKWEKLYKRLKSKGQHTWMDQLSQSIDNIKKQFPPIDVLQSFAPSNAEIYIPIVTRVERFHFIKKSKEVVIPKQISVIFTPMPTVKSPPYTLKDMSELTGKWTNYPPTSIVKINWKGRSGKVYKKKDMIGEPVVCAANTEFAKLWDFTYDEYFPNPNDDPNKRLTDANLFEFVEGYIDKNDLDEFMKDQERLAKRIIFQNKDDYAKVPLKFNEHHRWDYIKNKSYLPYLISKHLIGGIAGLHEMYLLVCYIRDFNPINK